jgi:hypothetical protein
MCGLVAVISKDKGHDQDLSRFMVDAAVCGSVRGSDSTGIFQIKDSNNFNYWTHKSAVNGAAFAQQGPALGILSDTHNCMLTVMHHRAATNGAVNAKNAHPFIYSTSKNSNRFLFLCHNGTLTNWKREEGKNKFDVDSEWAAYRMAREGVVPALKDFNGAFAFIAYDQNEPNLVRLIHDGSRSLHFGFVGNKETVLVASEAEMLHWLAKRNKLWLKNDEIFSVGTNTMVTFDTNNLTKYLSEKIPGRILTPYTTTHFTRNDEGTAWNSGRVPTAGAYRGKRAEIVELVNKLLETGKTVADTTTASAVIALPPPAPTTADKETKEIDFSKMIDPDNSVTLEEKKFLVKNLDIPFMAEGIFTPDHYDKNAQILHGEVEIASKGSSSSYETFTAQIRKVSKNRNKTLWNTRNSIQISRALGAFIVRHVDNSLDTVVVMDYPREQTLS